MRRLRMGLIGGCVGSLIGPAHRIAAGLIGRARKVVVEYSQAWLATAVEAA